MFGLIGKLIWKLVKLFILVLIVVLIFHNWIATVAISKGLEASLGTEVKIDKVKIDILDTSAMIRGIEIKNPDGFPRGDLAYVPKIFADFEPASLFKGVIHFSKIELNFESMQVIRARDGRINILSLKVLEEAERKEDAPAPPRQEKERGEEKPKAQMPQLDFRIDELVLTLGGATYIDLTGPEPIEKTFDLGVKGAVYRDIRSTEDVVRIVVTTTMKRVGIAGLSGMLDEFAQDWGKKSGELFNKIKAAFSSGE